MSDVFKKFIETAGKSIEEIRSIAEELAKAAKTADEKIPAKELDLSEYNRNCPKNRRLTIGEIAYVHESIDDTITQAEAILTEKISEMRNLGKITYNGFVVQRCAEVSFVLQGEFVADITDDFSRNAFCGMVLPMYSAMSVSQLRTYFTWRTNARRGVFRETDKPYVLLYIFELLNKIGVSSSGDAFGKLLDVWKGCTFAKYLDETMPRWLKDFCAYNDVSEDYPDIGDYLRTAEKTPDDLAIERILGKNYTDTFDYLANNSSYDIRKSKFFSDETKPLLNGAAGAVLEALDGYFPARGVDLGTLLCGQLKKDFSWKPFDGALVNLDRADGFRAVKISAFESYSVKRGEHILEQFYFMPQKGFIGYVLKSIEARLRENTGFKRKIVPNENMLLNDLVNREKPIKAVRDEEFPKTIRNAVDEYCRENGISREKNTQKSDSDFVQFTKRKIEIDISKLWEIREKSDETAKKLIVDEIPDEDFVEKLSEQIADEEFNEKISEFTGLSEKVIEDFPSDLPENYRQLAAALTEDERTLLSVMADGGSAVEFCREAGIFPETIFEKINEKALDTLLDIVIEDGEIIPDYLDDLKKAVKK